MKNLFIANQKVFILPFSSKNEVKAVDEALAVNHHSHITLNNTKQVIYYCTDDLTLVGYSLVDEKITIEVPLVTAVDDGDQLLSPSDRILSLKYLPEVEAVVVVASGAEVGSILQVTVTSSTASGLSFQDDDFADDMYGLCEGGVEAGSVELVGQIPGGFSDASWSPDNEMVVLACQSGNILIMSKHFDVIAESSLVGDATAQRALTTANPYNFLPGTEQYKALQAAQAADAEVAKHCERDATVSWRGDGQFFATSSRDATGMRRVRVWSRQGQLQSVSEPAPGMPVPQDCTPFPAAPAGGDGDATGAATELLHARTGMHWRVAWRPSGNLLAAVERQVVPAGQGAVKMQQQVVFFERNGLRRGEFDLLPPALPLEWADGAAATAAAAGAAEAVTCADVRVGGAALGLLVSSLAWSSDSKVLAVAGTCPLTGRRAVQLWTTGNYHWYLKQQLLLPSAREARAALAETGALPAASSASVTIHWQPERPSRLLVLLDAAVLFAYDLAWDTALAAAPLASCAVVDGHVLLLTHLQRAAIPPPLAARNILLPAPVAEATFCRTVDPDEYERTVPVAYPSPSLRSTGDLRLDLAAPVAVRTDAGDVLLLTDAVPAPASALPRTPLGSVHAPVTQPERAMGLSKSSAAQALPCAFAALPCALLTAGAPALAQQRHVEWVSCAQWRQAHLAFTPARQDLLRAQLKRAAATAAATANESIISTDATTSAAATAPGFLADMYGTCGEDVYGAFPDFPEDDDFAHHDMDNSPEPSRHAQTYREPAPSPIIPEPSPLAPRNLLTLIEAAPGTADVLVCVWFRVQFRYDSTTDTFAAEVTDVTVHRTPLAPLFSTTVADSSAAMAVAGPVATVSDAFLPTHLQAMHKAVSRVFLVNPGLPLPALAAHNTSVLADNTVAVREWLTAHARARRAEPWLAILTCAGQVIRADIPDAPPVDSDAAAALTVPAPVSLGVRKPAAVVLSDLGARAPVDCLSFLIADMAGKHVVVARDIASRLCVDATLVAPQCMSFATVSFTAAMAKAAASARAASTTTRTLASTGYGQHVPVNTHSAAAAFQAIPEALLPSYLVLTVASQQHALFTLDLRRSLAENIEPGSAIRADPHMVRFVERGSAIVAPIADLFRPRLILQMPRGNLELITPRSLGLAAIHVALSSRQYLQAFLSMRANRVDLNLLFDHDPAQFERDVDEVVRQLRTADNISLFLSALTEVDCTVAQFPRYHSMFGSPADRAAIMRAATDADALAGDDEFVSFESGLASGAAAGMGMGGVGSDAGVDSCFDGSWASGAPARGGDLDLSSLMHGRHSHQDADAEAAANAGADGDSEDAGRLAGVHPNGVPEDLAALAQRLESKESKGKKQRNQPQKAPTSTAASFSNRTRAHKQLASEVRAQDVSLATDMDREMGLGAEANAQLAADGSGTSTLQQLSRVQHWGSGDIDIRHVYANAAAAQEHERAKAEATAAQGPRALGQARFKYEVGGKQQQQAPEDDEDAVENNNGTTGLAPPTTTTAAYASKTNHVCALVLGALERADTDPHGRQYLTAKLTAHLRRSPPAFADAMALIAQVAAAEAKTGSKVAAHPPLPRAQPAVLGPRPAAGTAAADTPLLLVTAEKALKYVLILADHEELWRAALALYDLTLAASVAQHAGRDPKAYMPFLAQLHRTALYGPELTVAQTLPPAVRAAAKAVQRAVAAKQQQATAVDDAFDASAVFSHEELLRAEVPPAVGQCLQRAAVDTHLERLHHALTHYAQALQLLEATMVDTAVSPVSRVKAALFVRHIRRVSVDYTVKLQLYELAVALFCSPLPTPTLFNTVKRDAAAHATAATPVSECGEEKLPEDADEEEDDREAHARRILSLYAEWLLTQHRAEEAATAFAAVGDVQGTVRAHAEAGKWQVAVAMVAMHRTTFPNPEPTYMRVVEVLASRKRWAEAAQVRAQYLRDVSGAVKLLLGAEQWEQAVQMATTHADAAQVLINTVLPAVVGAATALLEALPRRLEQYKYAVNRLRIVRKVKLILFGAIAGIPEATALWNKGADNVGGGVNDVPVKPSLVLRIPGDDVLEFILTGVWRGVQTGLCADGTGAGSLANYSTATGATLASLAPSVAASLASLSSMVSGSASMASMLSGMSMTSQSSILSAASEAALTPAEKKLMRHMRRMKGKKMKKKIREGDPREEAELLLEVTHLTPGPKARARTMELLNALALIGEHTLADQLQVAFKGYLAEIAKEEAIPMPSLEGVTAWQKENIQNYFNWPASSAEDEDVTEEKVRKREGERKKEKQRQQESQSRAPHASKDKRAGDNDGEQSTDPTVVTRFAYKDWRKYTECQQFAPTLTNLTSTDAVIHRNTVDAILAYLDALALVATKYTTQLRNEGNAPKARNV